MRPETERNTKSAKQKLEKLPGMINSKDFKKLSEKSAKKLVDFYKKNVKKQNG